MDTKSLRQDLLSWWDKAHRTFPWRDTRDPYHIFVAEVLLHRTRAQQVVDLYQSVLRNYPTIDSLAAAPADELHRLLYSAGLRWRIDLLLQASAEIITRFGGNIPRERKELESIPGIGHYIATAIRCFAYGEPDAIIDSNVVRVFARVCDLTLTDGLRRNPAFHQLANSIIDPVRPRDFNWAILDLAALICTPRNPKCDVCPILKHCEFGKRRVSNGS